MRGHIKERSPGSWALVLYLGKDEYGKKKYKWVTVKGTRQEAEAKLAELITEYNQTGIVEPANMTVGEYLDKWLEEVVKPYRKDSTRRTYIAHIKTHIKPKLGHIKLNRLKTMTLQRYFNELQGTLAPQTIKTHAQIITAALNQAIGWELLKKNPMTGVVFDKKPKKKKKRRAWSAKESIKFLKKAEEIKAPYYYIYLTALLTGMRQGEILGLKWEDIDFESGTLSVQRTLDTGGPNPKFVSPKTENSERIIYLPQVLLDAFQVIKKRQAPNKWNLVFPSKRGTPLFPEWVRKRMYEIIKEAKLPQISFHELRHSHVTLLLEMSIPAEVAAQRLGHNATMAQGTYFHTTDEMQMVVSQRIDNAFKEISKMD